MRCRRSRAVRWRSPTSSASRRSATSSRCGATSRSAAGRRYARPMAAPVRQDDELDLRVDSLAYGGNGVARLNGFVVFVRRGLPGDRVLARVTKVKRGHAEALATDVLRPGPHRVDAPCAHYPACGGCRFQDLAYGAQGEA